MLYLSDKQIAKKFGVHRTTVWRWIKTCGFPKPVTLSPGCTRWTETAILSWESRKAEGIKNA
jgi:predicted DNA-binding transcriptional regulator AlpA